MDGRDGAIEIVTRFVRLVEERRLGEAASYLAAGASFTFPGGRTFSSLEEQVSSSAERFRGVLKVFDRFDVSISEELTIVYLFGTLEGEDLDGNGFYGVRFVDRFELADNKIVDQKVWNDMAESGVVRPTS